MHSDKPVGRHETGCGSLAPTVSHLAFTNLLAQYKRAVYTKYLAIPSSKSWEIIALLRPATDTSSYSDSGKKSSE